MPRTTAMHRKPLKGDTVLLTVARYTGRKRTSRSAYCKDPGKYTGMYRLEF